MPIAGTVKLIYLWQVPGCDLDLAGVSNGILCVNWITGDSGQA
jgi:hypothetical protein